MNRDVLSLFTGVGGFDIGLERAGFNVTAQAESDAKARSVLRRHYPDAQLFNDVQDVSSDTLIDHPHIICGGFPCQDISVAGKRRGFKGDKSTYAANPLAVAEAKQC